MISRGLRLYFIVCLDSSHNTDILNYKYSIDLPGRSILEELILHIALTAGQYGKKLPSRLSNTGEFNFNIIMISNWECNVKEQLTLKFPLRWSTPTDLGLAGLQPVSPSQHHRTAGLCLCSNCRGKHFRNYIYAVIITVVVWEAFMGEMCWMRKLSQMPEFAYFHHEGFLYNIVCLLFPITLRGVIFVLLCVIF